MRCYKRTIIIFVFFFLVLGFAAQISSAQGLWGPYANPLNPFWAGSGFYAPPFFSLGQPLFLQPGLISPPYLSSQAWGNPYWPAITPATALSAPFQRAPNATIIFTSPALTAVTASPGVILIGANTVLGPQTALTAPAVVASVPTTPTVVNPAPAPLFSLLAIIYASALYEGALSTANPLLFAYLQTLVF
ncbi:MAG: hypothetical protein ACMUIM_12000 [bacterium]